VLSISKNVNFGFGKIMMISFTYVREDPVGKMEDMDDADKSCIIFPLLRDTR
jgi:hypothetical protein